MIEDINIRVLPHEAASDKAIVNAVSKAIHIEAECVNQWKIIRRSIDARQRQVIVNLTVRVAHGDDKCIPINAQHTLYKSVADAEHHIIIIGAGPAGLFAALKAQNGQAMDRAMAQAAAGDYSQVKETLSSLLTSPEIKAMLEQIGGQSHE